MAKEAEDGADDQGSYYSDEDANIGHVSEVKSNLAARSETTSNVASGRTRLTVALFSGTLVGVMAVVLVIKVFRRHVSSQISSYTIREAEASLSLPTAI
jgi:hypothetical protein